MWATASSPSTRTSPRVMVVLPAAESPTTPRITGRGIGSAAPCLVEHAALQDVLRIDPHEVGAAWHLTVACRVVNAVSVPQPGALDRVTDAAGMREPWLLHTP